MPTRKPNRDTNLFRKLSGARSERVRLFVMCEGVTEKNYFAGMRSRQGPQIDIDAPPGADHVSRIRRAAERISDGYDAVWCVLDTELDLDLTSKILSESTDLSVSVALSSPSFELWLILHKTHYARPFQSAKEAKRELKRILPGWSEGSTKFSEFSGGVDKACINAKKLDPSGENHHQNPSSTVWKLIETIQEAGGLLLNSC